MVAATVYTMAPVGFMSGFIGRICVCTQAYEAHAQAIQERQLAFWRFEARASRCHTMSIYSLAYIYIYVYMYTYKYTYITLLLS